ncbi:hypothetical protein [Agromyces bauzanensis]
MAKYEVLVKAVTVQGCLTPRPVPAVQRHAIPPARLIPPPRGRTIDEIHVATIHLNGTIKARGIWFNVSSPLRGQDVHVIYERDSLSAFDTRGSLTIEHP